INMPTFLITGVSSGIGLALALAALYRGHRVIGTTRDPSKASVAAPDFEKLGGTRLALDVSDSSPEASVKAAGEREKIDVLVNGAGYVLLGPIENVSEAEAQAQMDTNFHGYLRTIRALVPGFRARRSGTIVNISSGGGFIGRAGRGLYVASKFAVEGLSKSRALASGSFLHSRGPFGRIFSMPWSCWKWALVVMRVRGHAGWCALEDGGCVPRDDAWGYGRLQPYCRMLFLELGWVERTRFGKR
ncbi:uncharacterized protein N7459_007410, partial [Penicillium hispanicum]|uniref:uncharacterized protein n=1 Tax=Penicillium hispanicum TaxID=1080232 RepID=UPI0025403C0F